MYSGPKSPGPQRVTLRTLREKYARGEPLTMVTAYDYPSAVHVRACLAGATLKKLHSAGRGIVASWRSQPLTLLRLLPGRAVLLMAAKPPAAVAPRPRRVAGRHAARLLELPYGRGRSGMQTRAARLPMIARAGCVAGAPCMEAGRVPPCSIRKQAQPRSQVDAAGLDILLVGDSVAMVVHGHDTTLPVTLDEMLVHCRAASRGSQRCARAQRPLSP